MNFKEYLEAENISPQRAAAELRLTRQHVQGIMRGVNFPGRKLIPEIIKWSEGKITAKELRPDWVEILNVY